DRRLARFRRAQIDSGPAVIPGLAQIAFGGGACLGILAAAGDEEDRDAGSLRGIEKFECRRNRRRRFASLPSRLTASTRRIQIAVAAAKIGEVVVIHHRPIRQRGLVDIEHQRRPRDLRRPARDPRLGFAIDARNVGIIARAAIADELLLGETEIARRLRGGRSRPRRRGDAAARGRVGKSRRCWEQEEYRQPKPRRAAPRGLAHEAHALSLARIAARFSAASAWRSSRAAIASNCRSAAWPLTVPILAARRACLAFARSSFASFIARPLAKVSPRRV